jgi:hypothetical protein
MHKAIYAPIGVAMALGLLGACSKPASQTAADTADATTGAAATAGDAASNAAATTADAAAGVAAPGGAVSAPASPQNDAVNSDANVNDTSQTPGSNSFTESQAKSHIESAGYTDVSTLTKTADGLWIGKAKKAGKTMDVSLDFKGAVTAK